MSTRTFCATMHLSPSSSKSSTESLSRNGHFLGKNTALVIMAVGTYISRNLYEMTGITQRFRNVDDVPVEHYISSTVPSFFHSNSITASSSSSSTTTTSYSSSIPIWKKHINNGTTAEFLMGEKAAEDDTHTEMFRYFLSSATRLLEDIAPPKNGTTTRPPPPSCGYFKCFVPSRHFSPDYGYTIGQPRVERISYTAEIMIQTYHFAKRLEKELHIHHLYHPDIPPNVFPMHQSKGLHRYFKQERKRAEKLNKERNRNEQSYDMYDQNNNNNNNSMQNLQQMRRRHWSLPSPTGETYRTLQFSKSKPNEFLVTLFRAIPTDSFLFRSYMARFQAESVQQQLELGRTWVDTLYQEGTISNLKTFDRSLRKHIRHLIHEVLTLEPTIAYDFQIVIDPQGVIWHFDLDRAIGIHYYSDDPEKRLQESAHKRAEKVQNSLHVWYKDIHQHIKEKLMKNITSAY